MRGGVDPKSSPRFGFTLAEGTKHLAISPVIAKVGFTLAEVLITLGIIGVVAAMTIPAIITKCQQLVIITQLKKSYSELNQAIKMSVYENGDTDGWTLENALSTVEGHIEYGDKYIAPYLKISHKAGGVKGWWTCNPHQNFPGLYCVLSKSKKSNYSAWIPYIYYLQSGSTFSVGGWNSTVITVDVNGIKGPNVAGYDVYTFSISNNSLSSPKWNSKDTWSCSADSTHSYNGWACASRIIDNGWTVPKDYPWK